MSVIQEANRGRNMKQSDGMIRSSSTRVGDWIIAIICF